MHGSSSSFIMAGKLNTILIFIIGALATETCIVIDLNSLVAPLATGGCPAVQRCLQLAVMPEAGELADEECMA